MWFLWNYLGSFWSLIQFNESIRLNISLIILNRYSKVSPEVKVCVYFWFYVALYHYIFDLVIFRSCQMLVSHLCSRIGSYESLNASDSEEEFVCDSDITFYLPRRLLLESLVYFVHEDCYYAALELGIGQPSTETALFMNIIKEADTWNCRERNILTFCCITLSYTNLDS